MSCEREYDICLTAGDTWELDLQCKSAWSELVDLTDYNAYFQVRKSRASDDVEVEYTYTVNEDDGLNGVIEIGLTADETSDLNDAGLEVVTYFYALRLSNANGTDIQTILNGTLYVYRGII